MHVVRPLFVSTYPPEECGLATFTRDSADAVDLAATSRFRRWRRSKRPTRSATTIRASSTSSTTAVSDAYQLAAEVANDGPCDVVSLQHEFGLYPGEWGEGVLDFVRDCRKPIVTTFHTLLTQPDPLPRRLIQEIAARSQGIVVMTKVAARLLAEVYGVSGPQRAGHSARSARDSLRTRWPREAHSWDSQDRQVDLHVRTDQSRQGAGIHDPGHAADRGRLSGGPLPDRGRHASAGEAPGRRGLSRESGRDGRRLGVGEHVRFVNEFLSLAELLQHLQACDVYVTPYPGKDQIASGTLAYAMAAGLAVVSTPYLYAEEVWPKGAACSCRSPTARRWPRRRCDS